jgi:hypothetical protein
MKRSRLTEDQIIGLLREQDADRAPDSLHDHYLIRRVNDLSSLFTSVNSPLSM